VLISSTYSDTWPTSFGYLAWFKEKVNKNLNSDALKLWNSFQFWECFWVSTLKIRRMSKNRHNFKYFCSSESVVHHSYNAEFPWNFHKVVFVPSSSQQAALLRAGRRCCLPVTDWRTHFVCVPLIQRRWDAVKIYPQLCPGRWCSSWYQLKPLLFTVLLLLLLIIEPTRCTNFLNLFLE
jgi:hypothetical protein